MSEFHLDPSNFRMTAKQTRQEWHAVIDNETTVEDILKPVFWVHVLSQIKPMALVDLVTRDFLLDMQVRVVAIQNGMVIVRPRFIYENTEARKAVLARRDEVAKREAIPGFTQQEELRSLTPDGYKVGWNPGKKNWFVQLKANGQKLYEDIVNKDDALALAKKHAKASGVEVDEAA